LIFLRQYARASFSGVRFCPGAHARSPSVGSARERHLSGPACLQCGTSAHTCRKPRATATFCRTSCFPTLTGVPIHFYVGRRPAFLNLQRELLLSLRMFLPPGLKQKQIHLIETAPEMSASALPAYQRYTKVYELHRRGHTQLAFAEKVGIGAETISRWLNAPALPERRIRSDRRRDQALSLQSRKPGLQPSLTRSHYSAGRVFALLNMPPQTRSWGRRDI
jgi:hypothetical protein